MLPNETRIVEWRRGPYTLSTDRDRMSIDRVHRFLAEESYWARGLPLDHIRRSIAGSIALGIYYEDEQIGLARVVTDCTRVAYLMDVFIDVRHRGRGLGTWLAEAVRSHPDLAHVSRWLLSTMDAHRVYERAGWQALAQPEWMMEVVVPRAETGAADKVMARDEG